MVQQETQLVSHQEEEARSAVERIGAFAAAARAQQLKPNIRQLFKRNILDSLGCAIAALPGRPFHTLREQFEEYRAPGRCTLIGGGKNPERRKTQLTIPPTLHFRDAECR